MLQTFVSLWKLQCVLCVFFPPVVFTLFKEYRLGAKKLFCSFYIIVFCITYLRQFFRLKPFPSDLLFNCAVCIPVVFSFLTFRNSVYSSTNHFQSSSIPVSRFYGSRLKKTTTQTSSIRMLLFRCLSCTDIIIYYRASLLSAYSCIFPAVKNRTFFVFPFLSQYYCICMCRLYRHNISTYSGAESRYKFCCCLNKTNICVQHPCNLNPVIIKGGFLGFFLFMYDIQHCLIWHPSDSTVAEDAGIELRTVATMALTARRFNPRV